MDDSHDSPNDHRGSADGADVASPDVAEVPIDAPVVEQVAADAGVAADALAETLVVLDAALIGKHSTLERDHDYVTVGGRRAYAVDAGTWRSLTEGHEIEGGLADAARRAHTEQARLLDDGSVKDLAFGADDAGVVVGVDTAEEMV